MLASLPVTMRLCLTLLIGTCLATASSLLAHGDTTTPATYSATAAIRLQPDIDLPTGQGVDPKPQITTAVKAIRSSDTLWPVIKELKLDDAWGKEVENMKAPMPKAAAIVHLNGLLKFDSVTDTREIRITARGVTPEQATAIAHSVAYHYVALRSTQEKERYLPRVNALWELILEQQRMLSETARKLDLLYAKETTKSQTDLYALMAGERPQLNIPTLLTEITLIEGNVDNLLRDGFEINHPRVRALQAEISRKQTQIKGMVAELFSRKDVKYSKALLEARSTYDEQQRVMEALQNRHKQLLDQGPVNPVEIISQAVPPPDSSEQKPAN